MSIALFIGLKVETLYGNGVITSIREDGTIIVDHSNWRLANDTIPRLYMNKESITPLFAPGVLVRTSYGKCRVISIREDGMFVLGAENWRLANNTIPKLYMQQDTLTLDRESKIARRVRNKIDSCAQGKNMGAKLYSEKKFEEARDKYFLALRSLEGEEGNLTDEEKAEAFELSVPLQNNIALCCLHLKQYKDAYTFANNAFRLAMAIENKVAMGQMSKIFEHLITRGVVKSVDHLRKTWIRKSQFYMGKSNLGLKEFNGAIKHFKEALAYIDGDNNYTKDTAAIKGQIKLAMDDKKKEGLKEKNMYRKSFEKLSKENDEIKTTTVDTDSISNGSMTTEINSNGSSTSPSSSIPSPIVVDSSPLQKKTLSTSPLSTKVDVINTDNANGNNDKREEEDEDEDEDDVDDLFNDSLLAGIGIVGGIAAIVLGGMYLFGKKR